MTIDPEFSVQYFIEELVKESEDLAPIMKQLHDGIADVSYQDLYMLRQQLIRIRAGISLLDENNQEVLAQKKKSKRRFNPFKK